MAEYSFENFCTWKVLDDGEKMLLANFQATITEEVRLTDGRNSETILTIEGKMPLAEAGDAAEQTWLDLPPVQVPAAQFPSMSWIMQGWGVRTILSPGGGVKEDMRTAIQMNSRPRVALTHCLR